MASSRIASSSFRTLRAVSWHCKRPALTGLAVRSTHVTSLSASQPRHGLSTSTTGRTRPSTAAPRRFNPPLSTPTNNFVLSLSADLTHSRRRYLGRSMFIQTETTPNADSLKFIPGVPVMETGSAEFLDTRVALASPLALRLFGIEGVKAVFYGPDFITVTKDGENPWPVVKPEVYSILMEHFSVSSSGGNAQPLFRSEEEREAAGPLDTRILDTDSDTVAMIKELLDTRVRPAIMEDGGDIEYRGFTEDGIVLIK